MEEGLLSGSSEDIRSPASSSVTPAVVFSTFVAACGSLSYGFATGYSSPAESGIMDDLGLSTSEYSVFGSILTFGGMIGALISGRVADIVGRRITMWLLEIFFITGWILIFFGKNALGLDTGRLLMGIGAGLHCYVAPIYIARDYSREYSRRIYNYYYVHSNFGLFTNVFCCEFHGMAPVGYSGALPCLVHIVGVFFLPESPRWLVFAAGSCIGCMITGLGFLLKNFTQWKEITPTTAFTGLIIYSASFSAGMGGTPWVIMSEIFPINIEGTGSSLVTLRNWFSSWIVMYAFNFLFQWSSAGVFFVFAAVCSLITLFVIKMVPETKGRTLEEIQASMTLLK